MTLSIFQERDVHHTYLVLHYVKMVHNGIEYGDMQLICEAYQIMKELLGMSADEMHQVFD